ncbi:MAG TPA: Hpt domain-containing protein [Thermoanaerobaculia bacterium]|jgi:HPt (histidine-containing phosphotransfer) domain-containing protein|nr:Hpt domain-containing protein [Thermoanaerobaculia bacterium]
MVVDQELIDLKREFLDEAREKVTEIQTALDRVQDEEARERVAYLAHQLKGSGGSYGYQRISTEAAALEKCVESTSLDEPRIQQYVVSLRSEIDRAAMELM